MDNLLEKFIMNLVNKRVDNPTPNDFLHAESLWDKLPDSFKKQIYYNPDAIKFALRAASGTGKPIKYNISDYNWQGIVESIRNRERFDNLSKAKQSLLRQNLPTSTESIGDYWNKSKRDENSMWTQVDTGPINPYLHDIFGRTTVIRNINPATKDTTYTIPPETWDLKMGKSTLDTYAKCGRSLGYCERTDKGTILGKLIDYLIEHEYIKPGCDFSGSGEYFQRGCRHGYFYPGAVSYTHLTLPTILRV